MALVVATRAKHGPNLPSLSRIKYLALSPYGVASRSCCATHRSVGERVTPTWSTFRDLPFDDEEGKERLKEEGSRLEEVAGPDLGGVIAQEGCPLLASWLVGANRPHILLNGSLAHPKAQFQQLPMNALSTEDGDCLPPSP